MAGFDNDVVYGINADYSNAKGGTGASTTGELLTNGQMWIGSTALNAGSTHINVGTITSPNSSITIGYSSPNITLQVTGGSTSVIELTGNSGIATPTGGNINVVTSHSTVKFVGAASTLTQDFGLSNLLMGTNLVGTATGLFNVGVGASSMGGSVTNGSSNTAVGYSSLTALTSGSGNTALGVSCGTAINTASNNTAVGSSALSSLTSGDSNIGIGNSPLSSLLTGTHNIGIGTNGTGGSYTGAEGSNILIENTGVVGESHVIRIGTQGSGTAQHNQCYLAGVLNTVSGRVVKITAPGAYPYTTLTTDYVVIVDTSSARTINLVASPATGTTYRIKDNTGSAAANNITITPAAGNIDGSASYVINNNYGAIDLVYNGTQWNKF